METPHVTQMQNKRPSRRPRSETQPRRGGARLRAAGLRGWRGAGGFVSLAGPWVARAPPAARRPSAGSCGRSGFALTCGSLSRRRRPGPRAPRGTGLFRGTPRTVPGLFPGGGASAACGPGGRMTHFPQGPRGCPARPSSRCGPPAAEELTRRRTLGWPRWPFLTGGVGAEARTGPGTLCWGMNWKMRLGGKSDRVLSPGFNPLCPRGSRELPAVAGGTEGGVCVFFPNPQGRNQRGHPALAR